MDEHKYESYPKTDLGNFETGRTSPRKNHGGIIALLLILVIFLSGVAAFLGISNLQLMSQLNDQNQRKEAMAFSMPEQVNDVVQKQPEDVEPVPSEPEVTIAQTPQGHSNLPHEDAMPLQDIYSKNMPSVVSITIQSQLGIGTGTGVILSEDGYIVTNSHVLKDAVEIQVKLYDGLQYSASLVGNDSLTDLAVVKIDAEGLLPAEFGNSDSLRVGDMVVAIGDPLGQQFSGTMTDGIISGIDRDVMVDGRVMNLLQTNAAMNSGNSGGPLINCYGQVIGINTMKIGTFSDRAGVEGLSFAIPSTTVMDVVNQLMDQGYVSGRPRLGIEGEGVTTFQHYYYGFPAGIYITQVDDHLRREGLDIHPGDILTAINGVAVTNMDQVNAIVYRLEVGDTVQLQLYRSRTKFNLEIQLTEDKG